MLARGRVRPAGGRVACEFVAAGTAASTAVVARVSRANTPPLQCVTTAMALRTRRRHSKRLSWLSGRHVPSQTRTISI